jgi:hypothetical protein
MRELSMTEAQVYDAGFRSKRVQPVVKLEGSGLAQQILFAYRDPDAG